MAVTEPIMFASRYTYLFAARQTEGRTLKPFQVPRRAALAIIYSMR
jgi:hypothetical protein